MTRAIGGEELGRRLEDSFPGAVDRWDQTAVWVEASRIAEVCFHLRDDPELRFDFLSSISAVDYIDHFEVVYHLTALKHNQTAVLKVEVDGRDSPSLASVVPVWRGADFQEREIWDLMGVAFQGHPNLKRLLTWEGFPGHPLRKDFMQGQPP